MSAKRTNVETMGPTTNGFTKAYGTAHDSEDDVSHYGDYDDDYEYDDYDDNDDDYDNDEDDDDMIIEYWYDGF